jgi:hypothetical protein
LKHLEVSGEIHAPDALSPASGWDPVMFWTLWRKGIPLSLSGIYISVDVLKFDRTIVTEEE